MNKEQFITLGVTLVSLLIVASAIFSKPPVQPLQPQRQLMDTTQHNQATDCWITINNSVYNVTNYLSSHPGGSKAIVPYCGKDATMAFNNQSAHARQTVQNVLQSLKVEDL